MTSAERPTLVLVGPMAAGKTSVGKKLARELGVGFTDTDAVIVREHGPIAQIFAVHGEERFRQIERGVIATALTSRGIVSLGGGAVLDAATRADLADLDVVLLTVSAQAAAARIGGTARPLLSGEDPVARWERIYESRRPLYEGVASARFDTSSGKIADIVSAIAGWVRARGDDEGDHEGDSWPRSR